MQNPRAAPNGADTRGNQYRHDTRHATNVNQVIFLPGEPLALERLLSQPRLDRYKIFATGNTREGRLHAYRWNAEISASLQIDVGILEVAVRNAMNQELAKLFGRKHWYLAADHVSYIPELDDRAVGSLRMAKRWLGNTDELYEWSAGKVIAELTFAF